MHNDVAWMEQMTQPDRSMHEATHISSLEFEIRNFEADFSVWTNAPSDAM